MTNPVAKKRLMKEARRLRGSSIPAESLRRLKQLRILEAFGTVDFDPKYNYKAERSEAPLTGTATSDTTLSFSILYTPSNARFSR
jgi:hypothetical protein